MKQCILRRSLPVLLCLTLALSLTACGGGTEPPETEGGSGMTGALSGGRESGGGTCPAAGVYGRG